MDFEPSGAGLRVSKTMQTHWKIMHFLAIHQKPSKYKENEAFWEPEIHRKIIGSVKGFSKILMKTFCR